MDNKKIGNFICELRKEKKLTQYDLAEKIPVSREAVSKWERGISKPTKSCIQALCKIFDVTPEEILAGKRLNAGESENITLCLYEDRNKKQKLIRLSFGIILLIILLFLLYYFIENYNSIHVYTINYTDDNITITGGIFTTTKDKIYFNLGNVNSDKSIKKIKLYYKDKINNKKLIYETDDANVMLYDFYKYNAYFDFKDMKYILKNTYLDFEFENSSNTIKIDFVEDFANRKIFNDADTNAIKSEKTENKINVEDLKKNFTLNDGTYNYQDKNIFISYFEESLLINMIIESKNSTEEWNYYIDTDSLNYSKYNSKETINSFNIEKEKLECLIGKCENYIEKEKEFFKKINEIH